MQKTLYSERNSKLLEMLRDIRTAVGLTQIELAERLSVHQTEISRVERGTRRLDVLELYDWLSALGVPFLAFTAELDELLKSLTVRNATTGRLTQSPRRS